MVWAGCGLQTLALSLAPPPLQEDISRLRRKLEKQRKVEVYADADEILQEEIKEYKVRLWAERCPVSGGVLDGGWWRW